jgi:TonB family protein
MIFVRRLPLLSLLLVALGGSILLLSAGLKAQQATPRKLLERTVPIYPDLARSMALQGTVKVEALVAPDGTVKSVAIKGGHPVLAQAAVNTVRRWKWEPAPHETHEIVELKFSPPE